MGQSISGEGRARVEATDGPVPVPATTDTGAVTAGGTSPPADTAAMDTALEDLTRGAAAWCRTDITARIALLEACQETVLAAGEAWVASASAAKGIEPDSHLQGEEWGTGILAIVRNLALLAGTLRDIASHGRPQPRSVREEAGRVVVEVTPVDRFDRVLFAGSSAQVWLQSGVTLEEALARMGRIYRPSHTPRPEIALVLGAGNISSIGPMDALYQLFAEGRVVLLKLNPVNAYLAPHLIEAFAPLVEAGVLRIVHGDAEVGRYLTDHPAIDTIHVTGSAATHDAIVFGTGAQGRQRKAEGTPRITTPITSELGNVSPLIVVPGPWSDKDLAWWGDAIASTLVVNAGFNCVTPRMIVQHRSWGRRRDLLEAVRASLRRATPRTPYYPGALERYEAFVTAHPQAERFGPMGEEDLPFTLIPALDPDIEDDIAYTTEAFCGLMGEVALDAPRSVPDFLDEAVTFCNEQLMGTLGATLVVHPRSLDDPEVAAAVERAVEELRYGTVAINLWSGLAYIMVAPPWGAFPGSPLTDIQSGRGVVHNTFLLEDVEKTVLRGPFRQPGTPAWFHTLGRPDRVYRLAAELAAGWDTRTLARLGWHFLRS